MAHHKNNFQDNKMIIKATIAGLLVVCISLMGGIFYQYNVIASLKKKEVADTVLFKEQRNIRSHSFPKITHYGPKPKPKPKPSELVKIQKKNEPVARSVQNFEPSVSEGYADIDDRVISFATKKIDRIEKKILLEYKPMFDVFDLDQEQELQLKALMLEEILLEGDAIYNLTTEEYQENTRQREELDSKIADILITIDKVDLYERFKMNGDLVNLTISYLQDDLSKFGYLELTQEQKQQLTLIEIDNSMDPIVAGVEENAQKSIASRLAQAESILYQEQYEVYKGILKRDIDF